MKESQQYLLQGLFMDNWAVLIAKHDLNKWLLCYKWPQFLLLTKIGCDNGGSSFTLYEENWFGSGIINCLWLLACIGFKKVKWVKAAGTAFIILAFHILFPFNKRSILQKKGTKSLQNKLMSSNLFVSLRLDL